MNSPTVKDVPSARKTMNISGIDKKSPRKQMASPTKIYQTTSSALKKYKKTKSPSKESIAKKSVKKAGVNLRSKAIKKTQAKETEVPRQRLIDELFGKSNKIPNFKDLPEDGYETPKKRKALKQSRMKVSGPKFEVIADHSSDMSTGVSKRSAQKSSARKSKKLRELHAFWDNDFKRDSKSKALGNLKKLYGHEKIFQGDSVISM